MARAPHLHHLNGRVKVVGKFLQAAGQRFWVKGVTYGTFAPAPDGCMFPSRTQVARDFGMMADVGINTVRLYTVPDISLLDEAGTRNLRVMVGVPWAQHVAFLDDARLRADIRRDVVAQVRQLSSHPSVALIALGNEIPAPVVRWHGKARIERFLRDLYSEAKSAAPDCLFTYVNYPPTEYLDLPFLDVAAFNVYLHRETDLRGYLARLQVQWADKPLLMAEAGADSIREGSDGQALLTSMQLRSAFEEGACGAVAFAWTDEWWRGGHAITDWAFGLVDARREPKPALRAVADIYARVPFADAQRSTWPKVSVVICAYNAADTIGECLASLEALEYPDFEIILVNDGSRDATGEIARSFSRVNVIEVPNGGLSAARNIGLGAASGQIVAYTDADARVEPDWLDNLIQPLLRSPDVVGAGGPNLVPPEDSWLAHCVGLAPGNPTHVLLDDRIAEHVPGCNMAFRRSDLTAIGGFNPIFLRAGDDVDVCWKLQARGGRIGFAPTAIVWHHPRATVRAFWRQQIGYGEGETWLRPQHPDKFTQHRIRWQGHLYSKLPYLRSLTTRLVNTGVWGTAPFPSVYQLHAHGSFWWPHTATWAAACMLLMIIGLLASSDLFVALLGAAGLATTVGRCARHAMVSDIRGFPPVGRLSARTSRWICRGVIAWLHFIQPLARAHGRLRGRSTLVAPLGSTAFTARRSIVSDVRLALQLLNRSERRFWFEHWISAEGILEMLTARLKRRLPATSVRLDDGWRADRDVRVAVTDWVAIDLRVLVEDHGAGRSLLRIQRRLHIEAPPAAMRVAALGSFAAVPFVPSGSTVQLLLALVSSFTLVALGYGLRNTARAAAVVDDALAELVIEGQASELVSSIQREAVAPIIQPPSSIEFVPSPESMPDPFRLRRLPARARPIKAEPKEDRSVRLKG